MKKPLGVFFILLFLIGTFYGIGLLYLQKKNPAVTAVAHNTKPSDDLEIITPKLDGLSGSRKTISAETGGELTVKGNDGTFYTLSIPAQSISQNIEIEIAPFKSDSKEESLDRGIIIGPTGLTFEKPVTLFVYTSKEFSNPMVYEYSLIEKKLTPQFIDGTSKAAISVRITGPGAYLVSYNTSRGEALSRLTLSQPASPPLSVLESARFLINTNKQLSVQEMSLISRAINQLSQVETGEQSVNYREILSGKKIPQKQLKLAAPTLVSQSEIDFINALSADKEAPTLAIAYSLHLLNTSAIPSTAEAQLVQMLKQQLAEKKVEQSTPDYDFPETYTGKLPLRGFDWAIVGQQLLKAQFSIDPDNPEDLKKVAPTLEPQLKEDITVGQSYCSAFHALEVKNDVCNSFDSKVEIAKSELWLAAQDLNKADTIYESIASEEADITN